MIDPQEHAERMSLNALIDDSSPQTPFADAVSDTDLNTRVQYARWAAGRTRHGRVTPRSVVIAAVLALTLGGAGAAAAATMSGWEPWAEHPDATVLFTLPSGRSCEYRIVSRDTGDLADVIVARDYLRSTDVLAVADVRGELARVRDREVTVRGSDGDTVVPATEQYSEDELYRQAVTGAITNAVWDELEMRGIVDQMTGSDVSLASQTNCDGVAR